MDIMDSLNESDREMVQRHIEITNESVMEFIHRAIHLTIESDNFQTKKKEFFEK